LIDDIDFRRAFIWTYVAVNMVTIETLGTANVAVGVFHRGGAVLLFMGVIPVALLSFVSLNRDLQSSEIEAIGESASGEFDVHRDGGVAGTGVGVDGVGVIGDEAPGIPNEEAVPAEGIPNEAAVFVGRGAGVVGCLVAVGGGVSGLADTFFAGMLEGFLLMSPTPPIGFAELFGGWPTFAAGTGAAAGFAAGGGTG
jgi:hypothetical protein